MGPLSPHSLAADCFSFLMYFKFQRWGILLFNTFEDDYNPRICWDHSRCQHIANWYQTSLHPCAYLHISEAALCVFLECIVNYPVWYNSRFNITPGPHLYSDEAWQHTGTWASVISLRWLHRWNRLIAFRFAYYVPSSFTTRAVGNSVPPVIMETRIPTHMCVLTQQMLPLSNPLYFLDFT